jgi:hypothetical protein
MLFLSESVYKLRQRLLADLQSGKFPEEEIWRRLLEADPTDQIPLIELGRLRFAAGDIRGAEGYFWRAIDAHPCFLHSYLELGRLLWEQPEQSELGAGLSELGWSKILLDPDSSDSESTEPFDLQGEEAEALRGLTRVEQIEVLVEASRQQRDLEPLTVTARLRPYRLIHQIQENEDLDRHCVDAVLGQGEPMVPLLVGVLRDWAQNLLPEDAKPAVENTLALLGEIGAASAIPELLEFVATADVDLSGAASWAVDRIIELHPDEAGRVLGEVAPDLDPQRRLAVAERLLHYPAWKFRRLIFERLAENLDRVPKQDRDACFTGLLTAMALALGSSGADLAQAFFSGNRALLSRKTRSECDELLEVLGDSEVTPPPVEQSLWTVYDICAGLAAWDEEEEEEDDALPPEPVHRKNTPGRNDPCWCRSGKKYKKCHLEADQSSGDREPVVEGEFVELRQRIGKFLEVAVPAAEMKLAWEEFFGDNDPGQEDPVSLVDWIIHDRVSPRLGRTVLEEYLRRHGSGLSAREREMAESWSRSFIGLYEVQEIKPGTGVEVKDLISGEIFFVHDVSMSKTLVRWDAMLARVADGERGREFLGVGITVPRMRLEAFRLWLQEDRRRSGASRPEDLKRNVPRMHRAVPARRGMAFVASLVQHRRRGNITVQVRL